MYFSKGKPIFAALALAVISACSSSPDRSVETIESRLSAAGFVIKLAAQTNAEANWDVWGLWPRPVIY